LQTLLLAPSEAIRTAIPLLTQFVFVKDKQKQNQLNLPPHNNMVWRDSATFLRYSLRSIKAQATGVRYFEFC
jgi:hypothetical protein